MSASSEFSWLANTGPVPKKGDQKLAASISSGDSDPSSTLVSDLIKLNLTESALAAIGSYRICEADSIRLLSHFDNLIEPFLRANSYTVDKLVGAVRSSATDEDLLRIIEKCTLHLEESLASVGENGDELEKYVRFVSVIIDARFMSWFVKSDGVDVGSRITRLTAVINRYRRALFVDQQQRLKGRNSDTFQMLSKKVEPKYDGRLFYHELKVE